MQQDNFDFYQEALKAFDAPIPKPKQEEAAPKPEAEVVEPAPQEKQIRKINPWLIVGLCAVLCLAIFMGLGNDEAYIPRGDHYIYGIVLEYGEGYITLVTGKESWYVELDGLKRPTATPGALLTSSTTQPIWVFYNGEPEETDQNGCTKKITATFWNTDAGLYTSHDEIEFDLDGDGKKESWSVSLTRSLPSLYYGDFIYRVNLTATDAQGNLLHACFFEPSETASMVFSDAGGKLVLVQYNAGFYTELELRMEGGKPAVYRAGEALPLYDAVQPPIGIVPIVTVPSIPTAGKAEPASIQFYLDYQDGGMIITTETTMTDGDAADLKQLLSGLAWHDILDELYVTTAYFVLQEGEREETYSISDDWLLHRGQYAQMTPELRERLMKLIGWEMPANDFYYAYLENGDIVQLNFSSDGTVEVKSAQMIITGRYVTVGNYHCLALGQQLNQTIVLRKKTYSMQYLAEWSNQTQFIAQDGMEFRLREYGGTVALSLCNGEGNWNSTDNQTVLSTSEIYNLRRMLNSCDWQIDAPYNEEQIVAKFIVCDGVGEDCSNKTQYFLLTGGRLLRDGQLSGIAKINQQLWMTLISYFRLQGQCTDATYAGTNQDGKLTELILYIDGSYSVQAQLAHEDGVGYTLNGGGQYVRLGDCVALLGWDNGPYLILLDVLGDKLVYDAARSTPDEAFSQTEMVTLMYLQIDLYSLVNLQFSIRDETSDNIIPYNRSYVTLPKDLAKDISLVLSSVKWQELKEGIDGIWMGSFGIANSMDPGMDVYSGMRLKRGGFVAQLTKEQWDTISRMMAYSSGTVYMEREASAENVSYDLRVSSGKFYLEKVEQESRETLEGYYSLLEPDLLLCYGFDGDVFILRMEEEGWRLLPGGNGIDAFLIPDNTVFSEPVWDIMPDVDVLA